MAPPHAPAAAAALERTWVEFDTPEEGTLCGYVAHVARFGDGWHASIPSGEPGRCWWIHVRACRPIDRCQLRLGLDDGTRNQA